MIAESDAIKKRNENLGRQLIKLGDMMGDGLHHEPDGKWIIAEYRKVCKALGLSLKKKKTKNNAEEVNAAMIVRTNDVKCDKCSGSLRQTRSGSMVGKCVHCGTKYKLLKRCATRINHSDS